MTSLALFAVALACVSCQSRASSNALPGEPAKVADVMVRIDAHMDPPRWATLERQLLADNVPACREFYHKYFDDRGRLQCVVRWGANDGPDDAFENFNRWPELHALGAGDEIRQMFVSGHDGLIKQYTEARTTDVPIARQGMYYKEFIVQSDWMHHGEGLQLFNRMALSVPADQKYLERVRRFSVPWAVFDRKREIPEVVKPPMLARRTLPIAPGVVQSFRRRLLEGWQSGLMRTP